MPKLKERLRKFANRNKRYEIRQVEGLNVLVETEVSKAHTEKNRFIITTVLSTVSAVAAIVAAVAAIIGINP